MQQLLEDLRGPSPAHAAGLASISSGAAGAALFQKCRHRPAAEVLDALSILAASDGFAFAEYLRARRAGEPFEEPLRTSTSSPLRAAELCLELASHYWLARRSCPSSMLADLYVGKRLLQAAAQCCLHLVQANLRLFPIPWQAAQERASGLVSVLSRLDEQEEYDHIFKSTRTVAVVGISDKPERPGRYVPKYLRDHGFRLLGVTPAGRNPIAERTAPTLQDLEEPLDLVIFFRRSQALGDHLDDVLSLDPRPATVWLQEGISNELFAGSLRAVGINVVSDRCAMQEHRRLYPEGEEHL